MDALMVASMAVMMVELWDYILVEMMVGMSVEKLVGE